MATLFRRRRRSSLQARRWPPIRSLRRLPRVVGYPASNSAAVCPRSGRAVVNSFPGARRLPSRRVGLCRRVLELSRSSGKTQSMRHVCIMRLQSGARSLRVIRYKVRSTYELQSPAGTVFITGDGWLRRARRLAQGRLFVYCVNTFPVEQSVDVSWRLSLYLPYYGLQCPMFIMSRQ